MKSFFVVLIVIFTALLQLTTVNYLTIKGVKPDVLLIVIISIAIICGIEEGVISGATGGIFIDIIVGYKLGIIALSRITTGFLFGFLERNVFKENILTPFITVLLGTIINEILAFFIAEVSGADSSFVGLIYSTLPRALYNAILAPIIYFSIYRFCQWTNRYREGFSYYLY